jgi:hypothetical protein
MLLHGTKFSLNLLLSIVQLTMENTDCGIDHLHTLKVVSTEIWFWTLVVANSSAMSIEDVNNNITVHKICLLLKQGRFCLQSSPYLAPQ